MSLTGEVDDPARELRRVVARLTTLGSRAPAALVRAELQHLADAAADAEGRERRPVPELAPHAWGDQLTVLVTDALAALGPDGDPEVGRRLTALRRAL